MENKTLLITGASGDIGTAITDLFKSKGYNVIAPSSKELDCSSESQIDKYFDSVKLGKIILFIHCAGWNQPTPYSDIGINSLIKSEMINSLSVLKVIQRIDHLFKDNITKIIAISSLYGIFGRSGRLAYTSSKHSLNGIIKVLALELGKRGIMCNTISPGFIETKMTFKNNSKEVVNDFISRIPLGRLGLPTDIAKVCYFLGTDSNTFITGQNIVVDGGYSIGGFQNK